MKQQAKIREAEDNRGCSGQNQDDRKGTRRGSEKIVAHGKDNSCNPIPQAARTIVGAIQCTVQAIHHKHAKPRTARAFQPPVY
jgi:hypothetical protein